MARILVVDDEQLTLDLLTIYLQMIGHESIGALSGRQAWDKLAYEEPDAVLLDVMLPDDNGIDICRKLRENPVTKDLPIIMISAYSPPLTREAEAAGASGYLAKPIRMDVLKSSLEKLGIF